MCPSGGNRAVLRRYAEQIWGIPTTHFDPERARAFLRTTIPLSEVLVAGSTYSRGSLKRRLYDEGLKERRCELCGQDELWKGRPMSLILDHVNGRSDDNRLENLRIVCPNCNATLDTHCGRQTRLEVTPRACLHCGDQFIPKRPGRRYCSRSCGQRAKQPGPRPHFRRVERPPYDELLAEIAGSSYLAVGRKYGVSDNAIRKWIRAYEAERRPTGSSARVTSPVRL
jgi:hypothetical protein